MVGCSTRVGDHAVERLKLRILHCLRAPIGGLFRHVSDLAQEQSAAGHDVGVVADETTGDSLTQARLYGLKPFLTLGLHQVGMSRNIGWRDIKAVRRVCALVHATGADILHGHGAKGGAYARLATGLGRRGNRATKCFYTPHGGSLHFDPRSIKGRIYMALERQLLAFTDGIIFESDFSRRVFCDKVGTPSCESRVIYNGVKDGEFGLHQPDAAASDFLFIGELRKLKGVDVLLKAMSQLPEPASATIVGDGPDAEAFKALSEELGLAQNVVFTGAMPAAAAFGKGRVLVVPSRAESLPYIVLEAGAGGVPIIATSVGGIPEIVQDTDIPLVEADNVPALFDALSLAKSAPDLLHQRSRLLQETVRRNFSTATMAVSIADFYRDAPAH